MGAEVMWHKMQFWKSIDLRALLDKKHKKFRIIIISIVLVASTALLVDHLLSKKQAQAEPGLQTSTVRRGDIEIIASGVGTLIPADETDLSFTTSGVIADIPVHVGQEVKKGDQLAQLSNIANLKAQVASAEMAVIEAEQAVETLLVTEASVKAAAELEVAEAKEALQDAIYDNYQMQQGNRASAEDYAAIYANYILALEKVEQLEREFSKVEKKAASDPRRAMSLAELEAARSIADSYYTSLQWYEAAPTELEQASLDANIALARARVEEALIALEKVENGPDPAELALAQAKLDNAEAQLESAKSDLAGGTLAAPMDGIIISVNAEANEYVSEQPVITIANVKQPQLMIYLDESDFINIVLGYPVEVIFDSQPDIIFTGSVTQVDPVLTTSDGVPTITGLVQIDTEYAKQVSKLPLNSNASIDIIVARSENAILVPVEALRDISADEYAVFVIDEDGQLQVRMVEIGLIDITYAEVLDGLQPGEVVSTGIVETQ